MLKQKHAYFFFCLTLFKKTIRLIRTLTVFSFNCVGDEGGPVIIHDGCPRLVGITRYLEKYMYNQSFYEFK